MGAAAHPAPLSVCPSIHAVLRGSGSHAGPPFPTLSPPRSVNGGTHVCLPPTARPPASPAATKPTEGAAVRLTFFPLTKTALSDRRSSPGRSSLEATRHPVGVAGIGPFRPNGPQWGTAAPRCFPGRRCPVSSLRPWGGLRSNGAPSAATPAPMLLLPPTDVGFSAPSQHLTCF